MFDKHSKKDPIIKFWRCKRKNDCKALSAKMITALCFVPVPHLDTYIDALSYDLLLELHSLLNWFEDNYVGRPKKDAPADALYFFVRGCGTSTIETSLEETEPIIMQKQHTKNVYELGVSLYMKIYWFEKIQKGRNAYYENLVAGHAPRQKLFKYVKADERIFVPLFHEKNR